MTELSGYQKSISEATGVTNLDLLREIEDVMRNTIFHSTLDWQTKRQFNAGAHSALALIQEGKNAP